MAETKVSGVVNLAAGSNGGGGNVGSNNSTGNQQLTIVGSPGTSATPMAATVSSNTTNGSGRKKLALPLHIQRLEASLDMTPFMTYCQNTLTTPLTSDDDSELDDINAELLSPGDRIVNGIVMSKADRRNDKQHLFNFSQIGPDRKWLQDILLSDTDETDEDGDDQLDEDEYIRSMLKDHVREQKYREKYYQNANNAQYGYYGTGLLSNNDCFYEHQRSIVGIKRRKYKRHHEKPVKIPKLSKKQQKLLLKQQKLMEKMSGNRMGGVSGGGGGGNVGFSGSFSGNASGTSGNPTTSGGGGGGGGSGRDGGDGYSGDVGDCGDLDGNELDWEEQLLLLKDEPDEDGLNSKPHSPGGTPLPSKRGRKKAALLAKTPEMMALRRRKVWQLMAKKELGKIQRSKANNHKEVLTGCKRVATLCMKVFRQRAMQSQKNMKETVWRAKRLTREMQGYWKRYDRVERMTRRRMEKEAEEQRKHDVELVEAKRQQRKLNFLITQTELYAHFMSKKLGHGSEEEQLRILNQLDEEANPRLASIDDYNSDRMKQNAKKNASDAFNAERARTQEFDRIANIQPTPQVVVPAIKQSSSSSSSTKPDDGTIDDLEQPSIFQGVLKGYQIKGMTWLANLYDKGISGILADEMGLGKTVQSIAFLCYIAEHYGVWGPFLIISPASTLHNWQQEMQRFVPDFNVVPYWGSPNERKILRQFWEQKDLHTKDASFHVVITSYQLVVSDYKYFNRIKWQYMVLDEAQAIKSSSSVRWKLLLGFNCRNRLLLSGTPIQNSMAELWALLHFIMPTLFDSHDEFNEWFSKDIESHAENKTGIDEKQISRLHMILKPFMLRRIKKDVENELSDKIEIMVYCPLTTRQMLLYISLKRKIRIEDLLQYTDRASDGHNVDKNVTTNLMNLVMQFRKVCNHPELFERRDAKSPYAMKPNEYLIPRLVYDEAMLWRTVPSKRHFLYNRFNIFKSENIHRRLFPLKEPDDASIDYPKYIDLNVGDGGGAFSFTRFCDLSPIECERLALAGLIYYIKFCMANAELLKRQNYHKMWHKNLSPQSIPCSSYYLKRILLEPMAENNLHYMNLNILKIFLFTSMISNPNSFFSFTQHTIHSMTESMEHRIIRSKHAQIPPTSSKSTRSMDDDLKVELKDEDDFCDVDIMTPTPSLSALTAAATSSTAATTTTLQPPTTRSDKLSRNDWTKMPPPNLLPEHHHIPRPPRRLKCQWSSLPTFVYGISPKISCSGRNQYIDSRAAQWDAIRHELCENDEGREMIKNGLNECSPPLGWSNITVPDKQTLISDAGKLAVLDSLLTRLKAQNHRVLIYSQMTKVIDLLEEYMWHKKHRYMRLDGSSKISARRDMVADFQNRTDIFVFLLSTRAGGLGINLTAADTVIFYDSDWNPTVDQQAMDRAHRLGQTKQVTVYRLICKGTIEERILQRAREKSEIQRMVISGGNFKPDTLKPKEVVSLLLDDEEIEQKYRQRNEERRSSTTEDSSYLAQQQQRKDNKEIDRKRKLNTSGTSTTNKVAFDPNKKPKTEPSSGVPTTALSTASSSSSATNAPNNDEFLPFLTNITTANIKNEPPPSPTPSDISQGSADGGDGGGGGGDASGNCGGRGELDVDESSNEALNVDEYHSPTGGVGIGGDGLSTPAVTDKTLIGIDTINVKRRHRKTHHRRHRSRDDSSVRATASGAGEVGGGEDDDNGRSVRSSSSSSSQSSSLHSQVSSRSSSNNKSEISHQSQHSSSSSYHRRQRHQQRRFRLGKKSHTKSKSADRLLSLARKKGKSGDRIRKHHRSKSSFKKSPLENRSERSLNDDQYDDEERSNLQNQYSNEFSSMDFNSPSANLSFTTPSGSLSLEMLGKHRRRHPPRGAKRGRPRGSRRGGGTGSLGRSELSSPSTTSPTKTITGGSVASVTVSASSTSTSTSLSSSTLTSTPTPATLAAATTSTSMSATATSASVEAIDGITTLVTTATVTPTSSTDAGQSSVNESSSPQSVQLTNYRPGISAVKRGPGRPRLKQTGPGNQGNRGSPRVRKPIGPLVVPLGSSPAQTPTTGRSPAMSPAPSPSPSSSSQPSTTLQLQPPSSSSSSIASIITERSASGCGSVGYSFPLNSQQQQDEEIDDDLNIFVKEETTLQY